MRKRLGIEQLCRKLRETRLRWLGHVERRDESYLGEESEENAGLQEETGKAEKKI